MNRVFECPDTKQLRRDFTLTELARLRLVEEAFALGLKPRIPKGLSARRRELVSRVRKLGLEFQPGVR